MQHTNENCLFNASILSNSIGGVEIYTLGLAKRAFRRMHPLSWKKYAELVDRKAEFPQIVEQLRTDLETWKRNFP